MKKEYSHKLVTMESVGNLFSLVFHEPEPVRRYTWLRYAASGLHLQPTEFRYRHNFDAAMPSTLDLKKKTNDLLTQWKKIIVILGYNL